ncbi:MAG TPA: OsmC family protein [Nitrospiraceae bacterium]|nr:OsmC family protein [Nitrospiraceae bacterium]
MPQTVINEPINGVNTEQMGATVQAVQKDPALATFRFRASNTWINGGHNRSMIKSFYGAGAEDTVRTKPFVVGAAEPPVLLGEDQAPNPAEYVLHALAACLTTSLVYHAAARGIRIESMESQLEGDLDLRGFLGLSDDVRKGFQEIRATFTVKSDATKELLEKLAKFSPVYDTIANPVPVSISIKTERPEKA